MCGSLVRGREGNYKQKIENEERFLKLLLFFLCIEVIYQNIRSRNLDSNK